MLKRLLVTVLALVLIVSIATLFTYNTHAVSNMGISDKCVQMIKDTEGFFAIPYWDYSQWTVGFGTRCPAEQLEQYKQTGIPVEEAEALLHKELASFETTVRNFAKKHGLNLTQSQFDALVSFTYNLGGSVLNNRGNLIVEAILSGDSDNDLIYAFSAYCMAGGEFMPGLMRRRLAEANMYLNGVYSEYAPASYCYVRYDPNGGERDTSAQGYDANQPAKPLSCPTRAGYEFIGWYTDPVNGVRITSLDETTHGMMLYAHWQKGETEAQDPVDPPSGINVIVVSAAVHVRCGPDIGYGIVSSVHAGDRLTIIGTSENNGTVWGQFADGWIALENTNYFEIVAPGSEQQPVEPSWKLPVYATVVNTAGTVVYNGPHTTYPQLKTLRVDTQILVLETMVFADKEWARYEGGWVQLDEKLLIHDENKLAHNFTATTSQKLNVRSGPGVSYTLLTTVAKGTSHTVYSVVMVDGVAWGRIAKGWVNLNYTTYNPSLLNQYRYHIFEDWYETKAPTQTKPGEERRDCMYCDYYETRQTAVDGHVYGQWYVSKRPTCTTAGQERRDCKDCAHYQTREIDALGHSFGSWYETKAATAEAGGEERRDCATCGHYETRKTGKLETVTKLYGTLKNHDYLYIRSGPGVQYKLLGQLNRGDRVEILDTEMVGEVMWGRIAQGWVRVSGYLVLEEVQEPAPHTHSFGQWYVTKHATLDAYGEERRDCSSCGYYETRQIDKVAMITKLYGTLKNYDYLYIRSGPGVQNKLLGQLNRGDRVEILETQMVGEVMWGRIAQGWVRVSGYLVLEQVQEPAPHTHVFGNWYESKAPTVDAYGQERRDCRICDFYETRQTDKVELVTKLYGTLKNHDYLYIRSGPGVGYTLVGKLLRGDRVEILETKMVGDVMWGRIAQGWVRVSGYLVLEEVQEPANHSHSFGNWYVSKVATIDENGEERRDCSSCSHHETRKTDKLASVTKLYGTLMNHDYLYIRSGPGVGYTLVGKLLRGDRVEILETKMVGDVKWARIDRGWARLSGYLEVEEVRVPATENL